MLCASSSARGPLDISVPAFHTEIHGKSLLLSNANANENANANAKVSRHLFRQQKPTPKNPNFGFQNSNLAITRRQEGLRSSRFQLSAYFCTLFLVRWVPGLKSFNLIDFISSPRAQIHHFSFWLGGWVLCLILCQGSP